MIGLRGDGLAGAGLAEHRERLARVHAVVDAVDGLGDAVAGVELHVQVAYFEQRPPRRRVGAGSAELSSMTVTYASSAQLRVEGVADRVAEHDEGQHRDAQGARRATSSMCGALRMYGGGGGDVDAPGDGRRLAGRRRGRTGSPPAAM